MTESTEYDHNAEFGGLVDAMAAMKELFATFVTKIPVAYDVVERETEGEQNGKS